jgi:SAM-dependent methyltransferase
VDWEKVLLGGALGFVGGAYIYDIIVRPHVAAKFAREEADRRGKPLLNVGAGTRTSSLRALLLGPQTCGDVNIDIAADPSSECSSETVCFGDAHKLDFPDKHFGVAFCSHVLEHLDRPDIAAKELHRVADVVIVIVPRWWCPHTWLHPGHKWLITENFRLIQF